MTFAAFQTLRESLLRDRPDIHDCAETNLYRTLARLAPPATASPSEKVHRCHLASEWCARFGFPPETSPRALISCGVRDSLARLFAHCAANKALVWLPSDNYPVYTELARAARCEIKEFPTLPSPQWPNNPPTDRPEILLITNPLKPLARHFTTDSSNCQDASRSSGIPAAVSNKARSATSPPAEFEPENPSRHVVATDNSRGLQPTVSDPNTKEPRSGERKPPHHADVTAVTHWLTASPRRRLWLDTVYTFDTVFDPATLTLLATGQVLLLHSLTKGWLQPRLFGITLVPPQDAPFLTPIFRENPPPQLNLARARECLGIYSATPATVAQTLGEALSAMTASTGLSDTLFRSVNTDTQGQKARGYFLPVRAPWRELLEHHHILGIPATAFGSAREDITILSTLSFVR